MVEINILVGISIENFEIVNFIDIVNTMILRQKKTGIFDFETFLKSKIILLLIIHMI